MTMARQGMTLCFLPFRGAREQTFPGYGEDEVCQEVANQIRALCGAPEAAVHFLSGGTQANLTLIASVLRPHQGVICADTGHINAHETGAVEATGHKVLSLPHRNGQITPNQVRQFVENHRADPTREHTPQPGMVYISNTTELGTVYTRDELAALSACCHELSLPSTWTAPGWAMPWRRRMTFRFLTSPITVTPSPSAAPSRACYLAKPW